MKDSKSWWPDCHRPGVGAYGRDGGGTCFPCDPGLQPSTSLEAVGSGVGLKQINNIYVVHKNNLILSLLL